MCLIVVLWTWPSHCNCTVVQTTHQLEVFENMSIIERRPECLYLLLPRGFCHFVFDACMLQTKFASHSACVIKWRTKDCYAKAVRDKRKKNCKACQNTMCSLDRLLDVKVFSLCSCMSLCYTNSCTHRNCTVARSEWLEWCDMTFQCCGEHWATGSETCPT